MDDIVATPDLKATVEARIAELETKQKEFIEWAEKEAAGFAIRIDELKRLIAPPAPPTTQEPQPEAQPAA